MKKMIKMKWVGRGVSSGVSSWGERYFLKKKEMKYLLQNLAIGLLFVFGICVTKGDEASVQIDVKKEEPVPVYYSALVDHQVSLEEGKHIHQASVEVVMIQGEAETFSFETFGVGKVVSVNAEEDVILSWANRQGADGSFLDITVKKDQGKYEFLVSVEQELEELPQSVELWNLGPGEAVGFQAEVVIEVVAGVVAEFDKIIGFVPERKEEEKNGWNHLLGAGPVSRNLVTTTGGMIRLDLRQDGVPANKFEFIGASLTGGIDVEGKAAAFLFRGELVTYVDGVQLPLLGGGAAVSNLPKIEGLRFFVKGEQYFVEAEKAGRYQVALPFVAKLFDESGRTRIYFTTPSTTVLPVDLAGLDGVEFLDDFAVRPVLRDGLWQGYVPTSGQVSLGWQEATEEADDALFFSSEGLVDIQLGAGLLRQNTYLGLRVLQGELVEAVLSLEGPGEILAVEGEEVLSWERNEGGLVVKFRKPVTERVQLFVRSQVALDEFPVATKALRMSPEGTVRHAGFLRVRNEGAVRLEVASAEGLMQLAPEEFPGQEVRARQQFVYRFPTNEFELSLEAAQITPEVSVAETVIYELGGSDRSIEAEVELDIREASLREWELTVPADYSVVSVSGAKVGDYVVATEESEGQRVLRVIFSEEVSGRQLVFLSLEKNVPVEEGEWILSRITHPQAKAVRGDIGVVGSPGFRISIQAVDKLAEKPLSFFPKKKEDLQLAFRVRERDWSATLQLERLPRSVEADVFHLYSLKDGTAFGSVVVNYFITGSPVDEWKLTVPEDAGNVAIDGQNVRTWRREGNEVTVTLQQPVIGLYTLLLTCEEAVGMQGGEVKPGRVEPLGVRGERGFVQVVSPVQVKSEVARVSEGLLKLDPLELPAEFRLSSSAPSLAVYQYTERSFELAMNIEWFEPGETVAQVAEFAEAKSRISRDGEVVTDVVYSVKSRGERVLRLALPEAVRLWEVRVNQEAVNARKDGVVTLVPLPAGADANETVEVKVRFGQAAVSTTRPQLALPKVEAPILKTEWKIQGDERRRLVLNAQEESALQSGVSGFDWVGDKGFLLTALAVFLLVVGVALLRVKRGLGVVLLLLVMTLLVLLVGASWADLKPEQGTSQLEIGVPVLAPGEVVEAQVGNFEKKKMQWEQPSLVVILVGLLWVGFGLMKSQGRWYLFFGFLIAGAGCLWMEGGAFWFYLLFMSVVLFLLFSVFGKSSNSSEPKREGEEGGGSSQQAVSALVLLAGVFLYSPSAKAEAIFAGDSLSQSWQVQEERVLAEAELTLSGEEGDTFQFLKEGVILRDFEGEGVRLSSGEEGYEITIIELEAALGEVVTDDEEKEVRTFRFSYEIRKQLGEIVLPTGRAAVNILEIVLEKEGWSISCATAVQVDEVEEEGGSRARLILLPRGGNTIVMKPRERDPLKEKTSFFVEVSNAYVPGLGLLEGRHLVDIQPAQGVVRELKMLIPEGLAVSEVENDVVADWRFSAESRELIVELKKPQATSFSFLVVTQRSLGSLPLDLTMQPLRVLGGQRELGTLGIAFRGEAQAERIEVDGMLEVSLSDFTTSILKAGVEVLHRAYRYGEDEVEARVRMVPVAPEIRVETEEVLSLGVERCLLKWGARVDITRAGIFRFTFEVPVGFEVESLSGEAMSHWNEGGEGEERVVTVHLKGQTMGSHQFSLVLAKAGFITEQVEESEGEGSGWKVPQVVIVEAARQTGQFVVRAEQGLRLRSLSRRNVSEIDPRAVGSSSKKGAALAFRLLQKDWDLSLGVETLDPWVTAQVLHEVTLREGQTRHLVLASLKVENAAIRRLLVRFPNLSDEIEKTLRASGAAVTGISPVEGEEGLWQIDFKRRVIGNQQVRLEWERTGDRGDESEKLEILVFPELRQVSSYVALRAGAQLEVILADLPEGWYRLDWTAVPSELRDAGGGGIPAVALRGGMGEVNVTVVRHAIAEALKLRVSKGEMTTVVSPKGDLFTAVKLQLDVIERSTLRIAFDSAGQLFNVFVNGESVGVVRDGEGYLFYVVPGTDGDFAEVEFAYAVDGNSGRKISLRSPEISVPLENIEWKVLVPEGYDLDDIDGDLELKEEVASKSFEKADYIQSRLSRVKLEKVKAQAAFDKADSLLQSGQQQEALQFYQNVANNYNLDVATNEDARVKLNRVQTDQVVAGLNSRRQRLYLNNRVEDAGGFRNDELEIAAASNSILQGEVDFRPDELEGFLLGNSSEENDFLRRIADRLVKHQKASEPAPQAISVPVPEEGKVFVFRRSVRVDEGKPLELGMALRKEGVSDVAKLILVVLMLVAGAAGVAMGMGGCKGE